MASMSRMSCPEGEPSSNAQYPQHSGQSDTNEYCQAHVDWGKWVASSHKTVNCASAAVLALYQGCCTGQACSAPHLTVFKTAALTSKGQSFISSLLMVQSFRHLCCRLQALR